VETSSAGRSWDLQGEKPDNYGDEGEGRDGNYYKDDSVDNY
jgi:hypothetical protein